MRSTDNRITGNRFETAFANMLAKDGFWVTKLTQTAAGQPADLIAVKNNKAILIDCKVCERDYFSFNRIEPNQKTAMRFWHDRGNRQYWFALRYDEKVYMLDGYYAVFLADEVGGIKVTDRTDWMGCWPYEEWERMASKWLCA